MKPETNAFLDKSRVSLDKAADMLDRWPDEAGRMAYLAGFHAAQAVIYEQTDRAAKTHRGVQTQFAKLAKDEPRFDSELRAFLGWSYNLKAIADYETGPGAKVTREQATEAITTARRFVAAIVGLLPTEASTPTAAG